MKKVLLNLHRFLQFAPFNFLLLEWVQSGSNFNARNYSGIPGFNALNFLYPQQRTEVKAPKILSLFGDVDNENMEYFYGRSLWNIYFSNLEDITEIKEEGDDDEEEIESSFSGVEEQQYKGHKIRFRNFFNKNKYEKNLVKLSQFPETAESLLDFFSYKNLPIADDFYMLEELTDDIFCLDFNLFATYLLELFWMEDNYKSNSIINLFSFVRNLFQNDTFADEYFIDENLFALFTTMLYPLYFLAKLTTIKDFFRVTHELLEKNLRNPFIGETATNEEFFKYIYNVPFNSKWAIAKTNLDRDPYQIPPLYFLSPIMKKFRAFRHGILRNHLIKRFKKFPPRHRFTMMEETLHEPLFLSKVKNLRNENLSSSLSLFRNISELDEHYDVNKLMVCFAFHEKKKLLKLQRKEFKAQQKKERQENSRRYKEEFGEFILQEKREKAKAALLRRKQIKAYGNTPKNPLFSLFLDEDEALDLNSEESEEEDEDYSRDDYNI